MNYFDDYYSQQPEPEQEQNNYIPQEPVSPPPPKPKKERKGLRRAVSVILVLALVFGSCGATALILNNYWQNEMNAMMRRMDEKIAASQNGATVVPGNNPTTAKPLSAGTMTPGDVYAQNVNAVVAVTAEITGKDNYGREIAGYSAGSGFFITADGYVVTNYHVIEGGTKVTVTTHNDEKYEAQIVGHEANNDLALLKVDQENLPHVTLGSSNALKVGDQVVAIGNVLSTFASSLTVGYVSGVDRVVDTEGTAMNMIQTDVAINSGNSGGPLFNMYGEVVGITSAKFSGNSRSGASIEGIGFAIPIDDVTGMIEDIKTHGYVTGAYLGVMVLDVDSTAQYYGLPAGAYVESADEGSAAQKAGIQAGDIITKVGEYAVTSVSDLTRVLRKFEAGQTVTVEIYRSGQSLDLSVVLDVKPREETQPAATQPSTQPSIQQPNIPNSDDFEDWYEFFQDYFG